MNRYPRETDEFQPVLVVRDGTLVTDDSVEFAVVRDGLRPLEFAPPVILDEQAGIRIYGYAPGRYRVWAKVAGPGQAPVVDCGLFEVH